MGNVYQDIVLILHDVDFICSNEFIRNIQSLSYPSLAYNFSNWVTIWEMKPLATK